MNMSAEHLNERSVLRFAEEVRSRFAFLESLGFRCVRSEATFVRYESPMIGVNMYHGRQSYEIGLEIESATSPVGSYSMSEILHLADQTKADGYRKYTTRTVAGVADGVSRLANLFHLCIANGILNDKQLLSRLRLQKKKLAVGYSHEVEWRQARRKSEAAWREKDYAKVVKALRPLRAALTAIEVAKLEFAERQCSK